MSAPSPRSATPSIAPGAKLFHTCLVDAGANAVAWLMLQGSEGLLRISRARSVYLGGVRRLRAATSKRGHAVGHVGGCWPGGWIPGGTAEDVDAASGMRQRWSASDDTPT